MVRLLRAGLLALLAGTASALQVRLRLPVGGVQVFSTLARRVRPGGRGGTPRPRLCTLLSAANLSSVAPLLRVP